MEAQQIRLLLVEDDEVDYLAFKRLLRDEKPPYDHVRVSSVSEAREALRSRDFDVALLDYRLGDGTAFDLFDEIPKQIPFVIVTGSGDEEIAVQAMKAGASDYLIKDPESRWLKTLSLTVHNAIKTRRAEEALKQAHAELEQRVYQRTEQLLRANLQLQQEIEQRKRAEEAVKESEERFRALTETTSEWIWETDMNFLFTYVSPRVVELLGYRPSEILGLTPFDLMPPGEADRVRIQFSEIVRSRQPFRDLENLNVHKDGHLVVLEFSGLPFFDKQARFCGYRGIGRDMTERKRAAELLIQSERLKAVAELAAGVAHNFNNLLQVMLSSSEVGLAALHSNDLARVTANLQRILEDCRSGAETVRRLQDFAAVRTEPTSQESVLCLSHAVQKALDMSETWWKTGPERMGVSVILTKELIPDCFVRGEENELLEVVINLVKNAVEAMPQGGELVVKVSAQAGDALLTVEDNGVGIPEGNLRRIFEPFFTTKGFQGTGMGLASTYGIVLRHGGHISAVGREGGGTRFSVRIPLACEIERATPEVRTELPPCLRVLIIDDQEPIVAMMEQLFARRGHTVVTALSGQEGLDKFERFPVDVVISDLSMPSMTGWQVGKSLKDLCRNKGIPRPLFLILTGWGKEPDDMDRNAEYGVDGVLEKPVNFARLMDKIRELFHERECSAAAKDGIEIGLY